MSFLSNSQINPMNSSEIGWLIFAILVFLIWALQAYAMKFSKNSLKPVRIFFYVTVIDLIMAPIPFAMKDFSS
jgi:glycerol uptake facilitator-like aquaporin